MKTSEKQRNAVSTYEKKHDRVTVICTKGTRSRIEALGIGCTPARFAAFATEFMLNYCERRSKHANSE